MRRIVLALLFVATATAADLKVDHVTVAGRNLEQLRAAFASVGLATEYGGKHTNGLTEMALSSFADGSYLELIAAQKPSGAGSHYWAKFIDDDAGPCAWAISVKTGGEGFQPSGRQRPDGVALKWESKTLGPEPQGTFLPFMIHDLTPRELRAFPSGKPTWAKISGVAMVVIGVRDLDAAVARYRKAFGLGEPKAQEDSALGLKLRAFQGTPVVLATPIEAKSELGARLEKFGDAPFAFVLGSKFAQFSPMSEWFGRSILWLDPKKLGGSRIGIVRE